MKLHDRCPVEGTAPVIYIGHREYRRPDRTRYAGRRWYAEYCVDGKHRQEALGTTNKQAAIRKAHEIVTRLQSGVLKPPVFKTTVADLAKQYLDMIVNRGSAPKTIEKYTFVVNDFAAWAADVGRTAAAKFAPRDLWAFNKHMASAGKSDKTRYDRLVVIKQMFKWGWREKLVPEYALAAVTLPRPAPTHQPCFTAEQVGTLLSKADPHERAIFSAMAYLGLRFGEARDLRWSDVNFDAGADGYVTVQRGGSGNHTKNRKPRKLPLHPQLRSVLSAIHRKGERVFYARPSVKHPNGDGPICERRLLISLKRLCKRCKFEKPEQYKLHTFRHAFASMCARNNFAYKYALAWMGHSSSEILDHYYTMYDDVAEQAMRTLAYPAPASRPEGSAA